MAIPTTLEQTEIFKSPTITGEVRAAVELDFPVFSGHFEDDFNGLGAPDSTKWFMFNPSWGLCTQWVGALWVGASSPGIAPAWVQSRHNLAFPLSRDTDWVFEIRCAAATITGYGAFIRLCGRSFRDAEAVFAIKANTADGLDVHCPDGFTADNIVWSNGADTSFNRYRVRYSASAQTYTVDIDANDDGTFEVGPFVVPVAGRYVDAMVLGNSTAVQGSIGAWTEWHIDYVDVLGTAETVVDPDWAAPFTYDGTRFSYLPSLLSGRWNWDKDNIVDAAELVLDNFALDEDMSELFALYSDMRFLNRRCIIEARAGDGDGRWTNWTLMFDGKCAEKDIELDESGNCSLVVPIRDRWRATADDMEVNAAFSDAGTAIDGVAMNLTVAGIIEYLYQQRCGLAAATHSVVATPNNTPRNRNVFRQSAQQAVKALADETALAVYQRRSDAQIQVQEWDWGDDAPRYTMHTAQEIRFLKRTESYADVTSAEQLSFENTEYPQGGFTSTWPPHREPFYGRQVHANSTTQQTSADHDANPVAAKKWWVRNRKLGSIIVRAKAQIWWEHNDQVKIVDNKFLGIADTYILDGASFTFDSNGIECEGRFIFPHPDRFLRANLMP